MRPRKEAEQEEAENITFVVFTDYMSFLASLFIILFVVMSNRQMNETFFTELRLQMGGKVTEQEKIESKSAQVSQLQGYIREQQLSQYALVLVDEQRIRLILNDPLLFAPGSAEVKVSGRKVLQGFATIIRSVQNPIVIEGHTDSAPVRGKDFDSNWQLSIDRAYAVLKYLIDEAGVSPRNLSIRAFGDQKPVASNDTPEGRARNRRVELNIIRVKEAEKR